jgi:putative endonuclease
MKSTKQETTRDKGRDAEQAAVDYLISRGYRIVDRNFTCKIGEIDVIAEHDGEVVFVEVRSSRAGSFIDPAYSVNRTKQRKIIRTAQVYLARHFREMPPCRFDVVLIRRGQDPEIELIPRAFEADARCSGF